MEDTTFEYRELIREIIMSKSVEDRFLMCAAMYEDAKELARISMPRGLSVREQEDFVFMRLHGALPGELVLSED
ncbi:MAG TPA: hypothetical protein VJV05_09610 [Pyrinomonadaceae bacterium]|nr:hypothetical protein [Pyrinomonadaceae bacterium]